MKKLGPVNKELTPRMKQVIQYVFDNPTHTQKQIATAFGLHHSRVSQILKSKRVLAAFPLIAKSRLRNMVPKAINRFEKLMNQDANLEVSRKVTERVLDTEKVLEPETKVQVNIFASLSTSELAEYVKNNTQQMNPPYIDVDPILDPSQQ